MISRSRRTALAVSIGGTLIAGAVAISTVAAPWTIHHSVAAFAAQGEDALRLQLAATADPDWHPAEAGWHTTTTSQLSLNLPLTDHEEPYTLQPGESVTVYIFIRNGSADLPSAAEIGVVPPPQGSEQDGLFDRLGFHANTEDGRTVLDGSGRVRGSFAPLSPGEAVRLSLTVSMPADLPAQELDQTTGISVRVDTENR